MNLNKSFAINNYQFYFFFAKKPSAKIINKIKNIFISKLLTN